MIPAHLIPTPDTLQVPWGWFQLLLSTTFLLHILAMNIMIGWAIITFCNHAFKEGIPDENQLISQKLPFTIAFTVNFGIAPPALSPGSLRPLHVHKLGAHGRVLALHRGTPHSCLLCSLCL